jgi:E3 ubiquitin-protein ligase DOA10
MNNVNIISTSPSNIQDKERVEAPRKKECRYCLSDDKLEMLIDPCNCEGTMKYVHQECLEEWIKNGNRQVSESNENKKMKIYMTICEICKYQMKYT